MISPPSRLPPLRNAKALGDWLNALRDFTASLAPMITHNVRTGRTLVGTSREAIQNLPDGVSQFRIKAWDEDDWLRCRTWNGKNEGENDVYVAKAFYLRRSAWDGSSVEIEVESLDIDDEVVTETRTLEYLYHSSTFRTVTDDASEENQIIIPRFLEDDTILAVPSTELNVVKDGRALNWVDLNCDARAWMKSAS